MQCYFPDGLPAAQLFACNPNAKVSACCRDGDVCVLNGYCFSPGAGVLFRRGCSDSTFTDSSCPRECIGPTKRSVDMPMTPCGPLYTFCCGFDDAARSCCTNQNGTISIPGGSINDTVATVTSTYTASATFTAPAQTVTAVAEGLAAQQRTTVGVGAGLGAALIVATAALAFTSWRLFTIRREIHRLHGER